MSIYVDTSAFLGVLNEEDEHHRVAKRIWTELLTGTERVVASNYVVVETFAVVQRRLGMEAVRVFEKEICPPLQVVWVDEALHRAGVEAMLSAGRRRLSLVDCVSFELMRRNGIHQAFCFDPHFQEAGFESLTPAP